MTTYHIGAQGFSPRDWVGTFYPPGTRPSDYLEFYAQVFDTVEMNTTFYAVPPPSRVAQWAERTPPDFVFAAKMPQAITHKKRLVDARPELDAFLQSMWAFGAKLGAVVIQLPPSFKRESEDDLRGFLELLPDHMRFAVEFRDASWQDQAILDLLRQHRVAWCMNDWRDLESMRVATTDITYLRLNGYHEEFTSVAQALRARADELDSWADTLQDLADGVRHAYIYVNNHYAGHAPTTINQLRERLGLGTVDPTSRWEPPAPSPQQPPLFEA